MIFEKEREKCEAGPHRSAQILQDHKTLHNNLIFFARNRRRDPDMHVLRITVKKIVPSALRWDLFSLEGEHGISCLRENLTHLQCLGSTHIYFLLFRLLVCFFFLTELVLMITGNKEHPQPEPVQNRQCHEKHWTARNMPKRFQEYVKKWSSNAGLRGMRTIATIPKMQSRRNAKASMACTRSCFPMILLS